MSNPGHDLSLIRYTGTADHQDTVVSILVSKWNEEVTSALLHGAIETLLHAGLSPSKILTHHVPGTYELPSAANMVLKANMEVDAVICLGCVVQGETRHFEFICQAAAQGIKEVSLKFNKPVIFGVLTPDNQQQALDRAGGKLGNKGQEAAVAALEMIDLQRSL
jgi:6,7-dimethyl-8-ribityllumazine synthase